MDLIVLRCNISDGLVSVDPAYNLFEHVPNHNDLAIGGSEFPLLADAKLALVFGDSKDGTKNVDLRVPTEVRVVFKSGSRRSSAFCQVLLPLIWVAVVALLAAIVVDASLLLAGKWLREDEQGEKGLEREPRRQVLYNRLTL
jgi:hypothetical protein